MSESKIFIVETLSQHRVLYAIKAESQEEAERAVLEGSFEEIKEMGQNHINECVFCSYDTDEEGFIEAFDDINDYLRAWTPAQKLKYINEVRKDV